MGLGDNPEQKALFRRLAANAVALTSVATTVLVLSAYAHAPLFFITAQTGGVIVPVMALAVLIRRDHTTLRLLKRMRLWGIASLAISAVNVLGLLLHHA